VVVVGSFVVVGSLVVVGNLEVVGSHDFVGSCDVVGSPVAGENSVVTRSPTADRKTLSQTRS
jgi:hypothetical protein